MTKSRKGTPLVPASRLLQGVSDPRAPKADVTNAAYLMGDVYSAGDAYDDDLDGDPGDDDAYGDVDTSAMDTYNTLIGDAADHTYGAPLLGPKGKKVAKIALGAGAATGAAVLIARAIAKSRARRKAVSQTLASNAKRNTIANQVRARRMMGKIPRAAQMPFYQLEGATLNQFPLSPTETFPGDSLKFNLDRQASDTPFEAEIVNAVFAIATWTATATGIVTPRFYTCVFLTVGISVLTANPGTIFNVTGTLPTINGVLTIAANPFSFTIRQGYYAKLVIFPWQLVTNKPILALGSYDNANPIVLSITGLPSTASVSMVVPGSLHPFTIAMRNRLL